MGRPPSSYRASSTPDAARILQPAPTQEEFLQSPTRQGTVVPGRSGDRPRREVRARFLARVATARRRALLVDYDGTLAPLTADRARAVPYPGMRAALATVALARRRTAIWIVSGRSVDELGSLLGLDRLVDVWGSHGMERRSRHGRWSGAPPDGAAAALLDSVGRELARRAGRALVERKRYGLAVHERGAEPAGYRAAVAALREIEGEAAGQGLALVPFDGGLELRPRGFHKGLVVERAFGELGDDAAVAYLGDDATDEDAFAALRGRGLSVLVRREPRRTRAELCLRPPGEVLDFFEAWAEACRADAP